MTYRKMLAQAEKRLSEAGCLDAGLDAWYLMEYALGIDRTHFYLKAEQEVEDAFGVQNYLTLIERRASRIPLQYLTGSQEFMGLDFLVTEDVLIPRQDTETLVEQALELLKEGSGSETGEPLSVLDMCTGSGCILISLLAYSPICIGTGVDFSKKALAVARKNAARHGVLQRSQWICSNLFDKVTGRYRLIVSNPPYIATEELRGLMPEVAEHEPGMALDGGADGLCFYQKICQMAPDYLTKGGFLLMEIGYDQGDAIKQLMEQAGFLETAVIKDVCGKDRVIMGHL